MDAISWQLLIEGAWTTLWISAIAIAFGVVAGLLIALVRMLRLPVIDQLLVIYISLARATPLVTLVLFLFLSLPTMGINLDKNVAAIVALTLNTSAFNAEIWRNAFRTFPREQREAAEIVVKCYALGTHKALGFGRERLEETIKATEAVFREFGEWAKGGDYFGYAMLARRLTEILGEPVEVDESKADEPIFSRTLD